MLVLEEIVAGLAYVWARAGFAAHATVLLGMIGLQPAGKPWLLPPIERARCGRAAGAHRRTVGGAPGARRRARPHDGGAWADGVHRTARCARQPSPIMMIKY